MTRSALLLAAAALWLPAAAGAQTQQPSGDRIDRDIILEGSARAGCLVDTANAARMVNASLQQAEGGRAVVNLVPGSYLDATGVPQATEIALDLPVTCNGPHRIRVSTTRGALLREGAGAPPADFRTRLDFRVQLEFAGHTTNFDTSTQQSAQLDIGEAAKGNALITISIPGGGTRLVAGAYTDTLIIEVEASS